MYFFKFVSFHAAFQTKKEAESISASFSISDEFSGRDNLDHGLRITLYPYDSSRRSSRCHSRIRNRKLLQNRENNSSRRLLRNSQCILRRSFWL